MPLKLYEVYIHIDAWPRLKSKIGYVYIPFEWVFLTWVPSVAMTNLMSIVAEDDYENTATMAGNEPLFTTLLIGMGTTAICWPTLIAADTYNEEKPWKFGC